MFSQIYNVLALICHTAGVGSLPRVSASQQRPWCALPSKLPGVCYVAWSGQRGRNVLGALLGFPSPAGGGDPWCFVPHKGRHGDATVLGNISFTQL